jgi:predicted DNA-binding transcriptional regulator YafY
MRRARPADPKPPVQTVLLALIEFQQPGDVQEIADRLKVSKRTIYRFLHDYRNAGMKVVRCTKGVYQVKIA